MLLASGQAEAAPHFARSAQAGDDEAIDALMDAARQADRRASHTTLWSILDALLDLLPSGDQRW